MQYILRITWLPIVLACVLILPCRVSGADGVEDAFKLAKELAEKIKAAAGQSEAASQAAESDASQQASYPGVKNLRISRGGDGTPAISIYYPEVGNQVVDESLSKFANEMAEGYEAEIKDNFGEGEEKPDSYGTWEETGFFTIERPNPDILSVTFNIYSYSGGAHGQILIAVRNYDLKTGKELAFADLFADPQKALAILSAVSEAKLRASLGDEVEESMLAEGVAAEEGNFNNLALLPDGVIVEFQPYQVGPWSIGQQHVEVTLPELEAAGPSPLIWPKKADSLGNTN